MTNVGTVDYRTDARGQTLPPVLPAHAPPLQLHNGRENVQEDRNLVSPPVVSVGSGSDGSHFGFLADQGGITGSSVHGMMVLNQPVYVSSVGGSSVPLGMAVNVQSEGMASNSQTGSSSQEEASSPSSPTSTDDLRNVLRQQLEYYFSKDNLATDKYLLSQMDGDHYVPVSVIASFNQVKKLTADMDQVVEAIRGSGVLQLDETGSKVRAVPEKRCILILREIPKETAHESILELFQGKSCPRILGCQFAENDCWYVTFGSEEEAQEAHRYLREEVREFLGNPIRARIKNTAITRPSSVPKPRPQFPYPTVQVYNGQTVPFYPQQSGVVGWSPYYNSPYNTPTSGSYSAPPLSGGRFPSHGSASGGSVGGGAGGRGRNVGGRGHHRHVDGLVAGGSGRLPSNNSSTGGGSHYGPTGGGGGGGGRYGRRDSEERNRNLPNRLKKQRSEDSGRQRSQNRTPQKLDFALNNFPPLPGSDGTQACPPPAPPPPALPDEGASNLADIVKGRKNKDGSSIPEKSASAPTTPTCVSLVTSSNGTGGTSGGGSNSAIPVSKALSTPVQPIPPVTPPQSPVPPPSPPPPVSLPPAASGPTSAVVVVNQAHKPQRITDKVYQKDKAISSKVGSAAYTSGYQPGTGVHHTSTPSNSKQVVDKEAIVKHTVPPRNSQIPPRVPPPAPRNRHREKEVRRPPTGMVVAAQRPSPKPCKKPAPPPPPTNANTPSGDKPSKSEEVKPEKLSYAQMAGQKPKPSPTQKPAASNGNGANQKVSQTSPLQPQVSAAGGEGSDPSSPTAAASLATPTNPTQHIAGAEENASFETSPLSTATQEAQSP